MKEEKSVESRLLSIKEMLDDEIITQEEYQKLKTEIFKDEKNTHNNKGNGKGFLIASLVLAILYFMLSMSSISGVFASLDSGAEAAGGLIALFFIIPHYVIIVIGILFNGLGIFVEKKGFALTGGILYTVSMIFMLVNFFYILLPMIFSYVGYAKMNK